MSTYKNLHWVFIIIMTLSAILSVSLVLTSEDSEWKQSTSQMENVEKNEPSIKRTNLLDMKNGIKKATILSLNTISMFSSIGALLCTFRKMLIAKYSMEDSRLERQTQ